MGRERQDACEAHTMWSERGHRYLGMLCTEHTDVLVSKGHEQHANHPLPGQLPFICGVHKNGTDA